MLEEEDLHFRSHLSATLLTVEPICLHLLFLVVLLSYLPKELWEKDSNLRPQGNEPCELPLLPSHDVIFAVYNRIELFSQHRQCRILTDERIDLQIVCLMSFYLSTRPLICSLVRHFGLASDVLASAIANKNSK